MWKSEVFGFSKFWSILFSTQIVHNVNIETFWPKPCDKGTQTLTSSCTLGDGDLTGLQSLLGLWESQPQTIFICCLQEVWIHTNYKGICRNICSHETMLGPLAGARARAFVRRQGSGLCYRASRCMLLPVAVAGSRLLALARVRCVSSGISCSSTE